MPEAQCMAQVESLEPTVRMRTGRKMKGLDASVAEVPPQNPVDKPWSFP